MPKPKVWNTSADLVRDLRSWWDRRASEVLERDSWKETIRTAVAANTFRAFGGLPEKPSEVFRDWAYDALVTRHQFERLRSISSQRDYDRWLGQLVGDLRQYWKTRMGREMPFGPSYKLPNLVLKSALSQLNAQQRKRIAPLLHVPLDAYTLSGISQCSDRLNGICIPKRATMNFIKSEEDYKSVQGFIRKLAREAGVPAIAYDHLAWDETH